MKKCSKCGVEKDITEFYPSKSNLDGCHNTCKICWRAKSSQRYQTNIVEIKAARKERRVNDSEYRAQIAQKNREYWKRNPEKLRERNIRATHGITVEEYDAIMANPCAICGALAEHLDHDHETGVIRGPLCARCNFMIGHAKDNPERLRSGAAYLEAASRSAKKANS